MSDAESIWRRRSDEQLIAAADSPEDLTEEGRRVVRAEMSRRGLNAEAPISTVSPAKPTERRLNLPPVWKVLLYLAGLRVAFNLLDFLFRTFTAPN